MSNPIHVASDQLRGAYGTVNDGVRHLIPPSGAETAIGTGGQGAVATTGIEIDPVSDYVFKYKMDSTDIGDGVNGPTQVVGISKSDLLAINMDGTNQSMDKGADAPKLVDKGGAFTLSFWVKPDLNATASGTRQIIAYGESGGGLNGFAMQMSSGSQRMRWTSNGGGFNTSVNLTWDAWNWISVTYDGADVVMGVNNTNYFTSTRVVNDFTETEIFNIGCNTNCTGNFWKGGIDDMRFYGRVLTSDELTDIYNYRTI